MSIKENLQRIQQQITQAEVASNRAADSVLLVAVTKQQSTASIITAFDNGITHFAENYYQEAEQKIQELQQYPLCWHFIGPIQSNKTKGIAANFDWVHSINRTKIASLLNDQRPQNSEPLNVCLQINLVPEETKSGIDPSEAADLANFVSQLSHLKLRGLMTIPPPQTDQQKQYEIYLSLNKLMYSLNTKLQLDMDTLSMGMSDDFEPAIKAGATIIRLGRVLFGERQGKTT